MSALIDKTTRALGASINMRQLRQNVTTANIANAETPGYKAKKLDFEEALSRAVDMEKFGEASISDPEHVMVGQGSISNVRADVYDNPDVNISPDGNTVNLEKEMTSLAENSVMYKAAVQLMNKKMAALKYAITEGGR